MLETVAFLVQFEFWV